MDHTVITTVVEAAKSYDLIDLQTIKDELGIAANADNAILSRYVSWASAAWSQATNRVFQAETIKDEIFAARDMYPYQFVGGIQLLQLSRFPLISVASVTEDDCVLAADTDYKVADDRGALIRIDGGGYPRRWHAKKIVTEFDAGFAKIPGDIADAVTRMVKARWNSRGRDPYLMSENIPGVRDARWWIATGNEAGNMPPDVQDILDNYRVPVIA